MLLLFFDVTGSKKMILGEMINFARENLARIQILLFAPFIQFTFKKPCARHFFLIGGCVISFYFDDIIAI